MTRTGLVLLLAAVGSGMLVKDWGTGLQIQRLVFTVRDFFQESFDFFTAAQRGVYPIKDLKQNYTQVWHGVTSEVVFMAYNGWLEDLELNTTNLEKHGSLRRMIITNAEKSMAVKEHNHQDHQHEMIVCDSCMSIRAKRLHYAYEVVFYNYETSGLIENGEIEADISFQLTISTGHNETIGRNYCFTQMEPISLISRDTNSTETNAFNVKMTNVGVFNFLAEHINTWVKDHFNQVILMSIQKKMDISIRKMLNKDNPCERFLTA